MSENGSPTTTAILSPQVTWALRKDLEWVKRLVRGEERWIARDPLTTEFYYFSPRERSFLQQITGGDAVQRLLSPDVDDAGELAWRRAVLDRAARYQLVRPNSVGQGRVSRHRIARQKRAAWWSLLPRLLAIKVPVFDPTMLLAKSRWLARAVFSRTTLLLLTMAVAGLLFMLVGRWDVVTQRLPSLPGLLMGDRVIWLLLAYVCMKLIHEASHALACSRWRAECHEIGFYFLAMTPCLYCDVSDVWKLPKKWPRIMVSAAGIFAEILVATIAGWVWYFTYDGAINYLALNLMLLGSLGTILVNANPLLRYDGYYILADLVDVPNLAEQSQEALTWPLRRWLAGPRLDGAPLDAAWFPLFLYGGASLIYRTMVLILILWGVNRVSSEWGLELFGGILTLSVIAGVVFSLAVKAKHGVKELGMNGSILWSRWSFTAVALASMVWVAFAVPLPRSIASIGLLKPTVLEPVFVRKDGYLRQYTTPGAVVKRGDVLAVFEAPADQRTALSIAGEIAGLKAEIRGVESRLSDNPQLAATLTELKETLTEREKTYQTWQTELSELIIHAPADGKLIEPTWNIPTSTPDGELSGWQDEPLQSANLDGWFARGVLLGWVTDDRNWNLEAYVSETQVPRIAEAANASIRLDRHTERDLKGHVVRVDSQPVELPPFILKEDPRLATRLGDNGSMRLDETYYRIIIALDESPEGGSLDAIASVRIDAAPATLSSRIGEYVRRTFRD